MTKPSAPPSNAPADSTSLFTLFNEVAIITQLAEAAFLEVMPHGLSLAGFGVLNRFVRMRLDHDSPSRMASAFQVTKGAMTNTVARLEALGFVSVEPDPDDGRGKIVRITPAGQNAHADAVAALAPLLTRVGTEFPGATLTGLIPDLQKLRAWLDQARN
jgi:DNA-binding MarR family transcriptional regulator